MPHFTAGAEKKLSNDLSPSDLRKVWDSTGKPLLRVGKNGVQVNAALLFIACLTFYTYDATAKNVVVLLPVHHRHLATSDVKVLVPVLQF